MTDDSSQARRTATILAVVAYITVGFAWGTTYGGIRVAVETIPPFTLAAFRFLLAGFAMLLVFRAWGIPFPSRRDWLRLIPAGVLLLTFANGLLSWAEQYIASSFAALVVNISPFVFVGLTAWAGERVPRMAWMGLCVGFCGVIVLVSPELRSALGGDVEATRHPRFWLAMLALVIGPCCWASGSFLTKQWKTQSNPLMVAAAQTTAGGAGALVVSLLLGEAVGFSPADVSARSWLAVVWLVVVGSWLGFTAYMYCVINLPPAITASTIYVNNVVALLVGGLILGERITPVMVAGGVVILAGVYLVNAARHRMRALNAEPPATAARQDTPSQE